MKKLIIEPNTLNSKEFEIEVKFKSIQEEERFTHFLEELKKNREEIYKIFLE